MRHQDLLEELASQEAFQRFHSMVHRLFGISMTLYSSGLNRNINLGQPKIRNPFCTVLQRDPRACLECQRSDIRQCEMARELKKPLAYACHAGLEDFVIPISAGERVIAFLVCGQTLSAPPSEARWRATKKKLAGYKVDLRTMRKHYFATGFLDPGLRKALMLLFELFASYIADTASQLMLLKQDRASQILGLAEAYLQAHAEQPVRLEEVAKACFTSARNLSRIFIRETGTTVVGRLHHIRVEKACRLIEAGETKILTVAFACGFSSIQHFNRVFRRLKNCSPRDWRTRNEEANTRDSQSQTA
jgi:AraC-like DNA-binding protein